MNLAIDANTVKQLRDKTGAGMMDCKNALKNQMVIQIAQLIISENLVLLKLKRKALEKLKKVQSTLTFMLEDVLV